MHGKDVSSEFIRISEITRLLGEHARDLSQPYKTLIGDDAAVINFQDLKLNLFASDMMVENIHFRTSYFKAADIGYKLMATNVSDMAAMGGFPCYATISLGCPRNFDMQGFYQGVKRACEEYEFHIAGGDLSSSELTVVSVAMVGSTHGKPIMRSTAHIGDYIFVTGPLGGSSAGLELLLQDPEATGPLVEKHKNPKARLQEAKAISQVEATSMIDVSDGLLADLNHICENSHLGAHLEKIPVADGALISNALYGGEDYELIFSHPDPVQVASIFASADLAEPVLIGRFNDGGTITVEGKEVEIRGFVHRF
ncbi:MAG: thiamine-phosphate kinase [Actinomycetota bacterium]|nr:MAG: thiamine-phosphate kinase [Actinomycetota bacterium]